MLRLAALGLSVVCLGFVAASWLAPERLPRGLRPEVRGLASTYEETYALWDEATEAHRHDAALAHCDEFLLGPGGAGSEAQSVWAMRALSQAKGASYRGTPAERGQAWRLARVAARRPASEWGVLGLGACALLLFAASFLKPKKRRRDDEDRGPVGPRPGLAPRPEGDF